MIALTDKQCKLWYNLDNDNYNRYLIYGGTRSGKTLTITGWLLSQMIQHPKMSILCLRKHRTHIKTSLWNGTIKEILQDRKDFNFEESTLTLTHENGSVMRLDGLDTKERVDKILGNEYTHIFVNEASQVDYAAVKIAISRLAQNIKGVNSRKMIYDLNPTGPLHWLYQLGMKGIDPEEQTPTDISNWCKMQFIPSDNPYLPEDYIESLKKLTGVARKRLYEGEWCAADTMVYPSYDNSVHCKNLDHLIHENTDYMIGIDAGYNPDPTVISLFAIVTVNDEKCLYLHDLYYQQGKDMSLSIGDLCEKYRKLNPFIVVDPSASPAIVELNSRQFRVEKGINKMIDGITVLGDLISTNRFYVKPEVSQKFHDEIMSYELDPKTEKPTGTTPDHILDTCRYVAMAFQESKTEQPVYIF